MEVQTRHSTRRDAVLECLRKHHDHPTADILYNEIRKEYPNISLGTVYRNLNFFVEHGEAVRIPVTDGQTRFDGNVTPHFHFRCSVCGALLDLNLEDGMEVKENLSHPKTNFKGQITGYDLVFTGICEHCLKSEKQK